MGVRQIDDPLEQFPVDFSYHVFPEVCAHDCPLQGLGDLAERRHMHPTLGVHDCNPLKGPFLQFQMFCGFCLGANHCRCRIAIGNFIEQWKHLVS